MDWRSFMYKVLLGFSFRVLFVSIVIQYTYLHVFCLNLTVIWFIVIKIFKNKFIVKIV